MRPGAGVYIVYLYKQLSRAITAIEKWQDQRSIAHGPLPYSSLLNTWFLGAFRMLRVQTLKAVNVIASIASALNKITNMKADKVWLQCPMKSGVQVGLQALRKTFDDSYG